MISTAQNSLQSPLLRLPAELRDKIWHFAYGSEDVHCVWVDESEPNGKATYCVKHYGWKYPAVPKLVSRQYWAESFVVFLASYSLSFFDSNVFFNFVRSDAPIVSMVCRIDITSVMGDIRSPDSTKSWATVLSRAPTDRLTRLEGANVWIQDELGELRASDLEDMVDSDGSSDICILHIIEFLRQHKLKRGLARFSMFVMPHRGRGIDLARQRVENWAINRMLDYRGRA